MRNAVRWHYKGYVNLKNEWIEEMKETGRLKLTVMGLLTHYLLAIFFVMPLIGLLSKIIIANVNNSNIGIQDFSGLLLGSILLAFLGILFYLLQRSRLNFRIIYTSLSRGELQERIIKTAKELEWHSVIDKKNIMSYKTNPKLWTGSWGEQITILFDENRIMINSICDPDKQASVVSVGRNKKNVKRLIENIKAEQYKN